jgi:hypothetical protein
MALFGLLLPLSVAALFDSPYIEHVDLAAYRAAVQDPDYLVVSVIYDEAGEGSQTLSRLLEAVLPKYHFFCKVVALDCTYDSEACPKEIRSSLPALTSYQPAGLNPYTGKPLVYQRDYEGMIGEKELTDWLASYTAFFGEELNDDNFKAFSEEELNKVLLFSNKAHVPLMIKGLSCKYRGRLEFGFIGKDQRDLHTHYQVSASPTILVLTQDGAHTYEGAAEFEAISDYLEAFASSEKKPAKIKQAKDLPREVVDGFEARSVKAEDFEELLERSQKLVLVHYYKQNVAPSWPDVKDKYKGVVDLVELDCSQDTNWELAKTHGAKRLPSMRLFPANRKRKSLEISFDEYFEETVSKELRYTIHPVNDHSMGLFVQSMKDLDKIGFLLLSDKPLSLQFKAIAAEPYFKETMSFGYYAGSDKEILRSFSLNRHPTIVAFITVGDEGQMNTAEYAGSLEDFKAIHSFAEDLLKAFDKQPEDDEDWREEDIPHFDSLNFNRLCLKKGGVCVVALLEGALVSSSQTDKHNSRHLETLQRLQAEAYKQKTPTRYGWVDGVCQHDVREAFNIPETALPNVGFYFPGKKL